MIIVIVLIYWWISVCRFHYYRFRLRSNSTYMTSDVFMVFNTLASFIYIYIYIVIFVIYDHEIFNIPSSSGALPITIGRKSNRTAILVFYILSKWELKSLHFSYIYYHTKFRGTEVSGVPASGHCQDVCDTDVRKLINTKIVWPLVWGWSHRVCQLLCKLSSGAINKVST